MKWTTVLALFTILLWVTVLSVEQYRQIFMPSTETVESPESITSNTTSEEEKIRMQLEALDAETQDHPKLTEDEVTTQLDALAVSSSETPVLTEAEIRAQLDALSI